MEILATFKSTPEQDGETTKAMSVLSGLRKFRNWWEHSRNIDKKSGLRNKLRNIELSAEFPSANVSCIYSACIDYRTYSVYSLRFSKPI